MVKARQDARTKAQLVQENDQLVQEKDLIVQQKDQLVRKVCVTICIYTCHARLFLARVPRLPVEMRIQPM